MSRKHHLHEAVGNSALGLVAVIATLLIGGCGGSEPATSEEAAVDPRFASAEALIEYYNKITVHTSRVDMAAAVELLYPENALQEQLVRITRHMIPFAEVQQACWDQFGQGFSPGERYPPYSPNPEPARLVEHTGQRAKAVEVEPDGTNSDLYLVQIDNRWWISGYSLEYHPLIAGNLDSLDIFEQNMATLAAIAPEVAADVRRGMFASVAELRMAMGLSPGD